LRKKRTRFARATMRAFMRLLYNGDTRQDVRAPVVHFFRNGY
jgi:hypothetical protein